MPLHGIGARVGFMVLMILWMAVAMVDGHHHLGEVLDVEAAGMIGGTGPADCLNHAFLACDVDFCSGANGMTPLPEGSACTVCDGSDTTTYQICAGPTDRDAIPCSSTGSHDCTGRQSRGTCGSGICSGVTVIGDCTRVVWRCQN